MCTHLSLFRNIFGRDFGNFCSWGFYTNKDTCPAFTRICFMVCMSWSCRWRCWLQRFETGVLGNSIGKVSRKAAMIQENSWERPLRSSDPTFDHHLCQLEHGTKCYIQSCNEKVVYVDICKQQGWVISALKYRIHSGKRSVFLKICIAIIFWHGCCDADWFLVWKEAAQHNFSAPCSGCGSLGAHLMRKGSLRHPDN